MMGSEGVGAATLRPVWNRAIELGERVGDADELTAALNGLAVQEAANADLDAAIALARRQLAIADESGSRLARLRGHGTMGMALFYRGRRPGGARALHRVARALPARRLPHRHLRRRARPGHLRPGDELVGAVVARPAGRRARRDPSDRGGGRAPRVDAEPGDGPPLPLPDPPAAPRGRSRPGAGSAQRGVCRRAGLPAVAGGGPGRRGHRACVHGRSGRPRRGRARTGPAGRRRDAFRDLERARDAGRGAPRGRRYAGGGRHRRGGPQPQQRDRRALLGRRADPAQGRVHAGRRAGHRRAGGDSAARRAGGCDGAGSGIARAASRDDARPPARRTAAATTLGPPSRPPWPAYRADARPPTYARPTT